MMRKLVATAVLLGAFTVPAAASATVGDLDGSFSDDGLVTATMDVRDTALGPDGSLLALAVDRMRGSYVARFLANGEPDNGSGIQNGYIGPALYGAGNVGTAIDVRDNGRIVAGGIVHPPGTLPTDFAFAELEPDGKPACGDAVSCAMTDFGGRDDRLYDLFAEPSGKTLAAGVSLAPNANRLAVARYLPSGGPDTSFSDDGKLLFDTGGATTFAEDAAVAGLPDGSVLLAGAGPGPDGRDAGDLLLAKLKPDGDLDPSFGGGDGWATLDVESRDDATAIQVAPGGSIVVGIKACAYGLHTSCRPAVARFTASGELDPGFGAGGVVVDTPGSELTVAEDGSVYVAGASPVRKYFSTDFAVSRLDAGGAVDPVFGGDGVANADFDLKRDYATAVELDSRGRLIAAGHAGSVGRYGIAAFELLDGLPDMDADGKLDADDRCPERYSKHPKTGCPSVARELKLRTTKGRVEAKIKAGLQPCAARQRVRLVRLGDKSSPVVARDRTAGQGKAKLGFKPDPGRYRAKVKQKVAPELARCRRAKSKVLRVRG
jgi:uncharacterized delta-60 repeat protein